MTRLDSSPKPWRLPSREAASTNAVSVSDEKTMPTPTRRPEASGGPMGIGVFAPVSWQLVQADRTARMVGAAVGVLVGTGTFHSMKLRRVPEGGSPKRIIAV